MRIGIIGCGYVGKAAAAKWKQAGHFVSATTRHPKRLIELQDVSDDVFILNNQDLRSFLSNQDAALISVAPDSPSADYESTYLATAKAVAKSLPDCKGLKQIIYTSSASVYGEHEGDWVDETIEIRPLTERSRVLNETEQVLLRERGPNLKVCVLRLGEIYGPQREIENRLKHREGLPFAGTGDQFANLIHLEDIANALNFALDYHLDGIYNLCNDDHRPRKQLYADLCQRFNLSPIQWNPSLKSPHGGNKRLSNQKLKEAGFSFVHPFLETSQ